MFVEKNVDEPDNAEEFAKVSDFPMVPLVLVGDQKVQGLNLSLLSKMLMV